ncbi:MAG: Tm-1-like ATP-binding domain-containing protein [Anaerolineae bacterium]|nr:Tm-1-like ATP-binding domain-containing protein [Anaerolineae bacterium]
MSKKIVIVATLDTKSEEARYLEERIEEAGLETVVVDAGVLGQGTFPADITNEQVARLGGSALSELRGLKDEGKAMEAMARGATQAVQDLYRQGRLDGIIGLGGSMGTSLATQVMRSLPFGLPKVMVTTMASRDISPWIGHTDIVVLPSVADLSGLNRMTKRTLSNAAGAIVGMVRADLAVRDGERPIIAIGTLGATEACARHARPLLENMGYETIVFHTVGSGGRALEELIAEGQTGGVLEISIQEIFGNLLGSPYDAGPDRFESAGRIGVPQVVLPGNADFIAWSPPAALPSRYRGRHLHMHNPAITLVRSNAEEMRIIARAVAEKLNKGKGPTAVVIPTEGFSDYSRKGMFFYEPETDRVFTETLRQAIDPRIEVIEVPSDINSPACAEAMVEAFRGIQT